MEIEVVSTPNGIRTLEGAKKYCQDFARVCCSEKDFSEVRREAYDSKLVEDRLIKLGHLSVFDHFNIGLYIKGLPKVMAMVLNNEPPLTTSEKSARYTIMKGIPEGQKDLYDKWMGIVHSRIEKYYPESNYPKMYMKDGSRKTKVDKLSQENARYMMSVFTPTKMGYTFSLRQLNILADNFEWFGKEFAGDKFKGRVFEKGMKPYLDSEAVKKFRIRGLGDKSNRGVKLFGDEVEEYFGKDIYSTNLKMSFACLAQNHRHRTLHNAIFGGLEMGAGNGFFVPPIIREDDELVNDWFNDLADVAKNDFPQAQIVDVSERGLFEDLEMKVAERNCRHAQLEIVRMIDEQILFKGAGANSKYGDLRDASCWIYGDGCHKGGCDFGADNYLKRLI